MELIAVLCGLGALFVLAALCRLRVRRARAREHACLTRHMAERERIARELHDALLQSVTGLALQLHAALKQLPQDSPQRATLERVLSRTNATLVGGRERARELRRGDIFGRALIEALLEVRHELSQELPSLQIRVSVHGGPRRLTELVHEQAYCIGREAMTNAALHAQSQCVEVEVHFALQAFVLIVRDDGRGIGPDTLNASRKEGRGGLPDMAGRARRSGGRLHVRNRSDRGAEVLLEVPAAAAYANQKQRWWPFGRVRQV